MIGTKKKRDDAFLTLPNMVLMLVIAVLVVLADLLFILPFDLQGESGLFGIALLVVAVGMIPHTGTATLISIMAGFIAAIVDPSQHGWLYTVVIILATGLGIEIGVLIMGSVRSGLVAVLVAILGNLLHFTTKWFYSVLVSAPVGIIPTRVSETAFQHVLFGLLGGLLGFTVLYLLETYRRRSAPII